MEEEGVDVGGVDAADAGGLSDGEGTNLSEFFAGFFGEGADGVVIQVGGQGAVGLPSNLVDLVLLALKIARVLNFDFDTFAHVARKRGVAQIIVNQVGVMETRTA